MTIIVVNANRIIEGTLRNILEREGTLRSVASGDIERYLMPAAAVPAVADAPPVPPPNLDHARADIASILDQPATTVAFTSPVFQPDLVFYCPGNNEQTAEYDIVKLRRACAFRDVPLLVLCERSFARMAQNLVAMGANDWIALPLQPEALRTRVGMALRPVGAKMPILTRLINPFINATLDLMTTMAGLQVVRRDLFLKKDYRLFGDISGIMNFSGKIDGSVVVSFNTELARDIVARILSVPDISISPADLRDGVGEIVNIISGNAKASLAGTEFGHEITLPAVVTGQGHEIRHPSNAPCIVIIFDAGGRPFAVQICMVVRS
ncbi:MAG: chemotaxis protein CheX [Fibrobacterota bacterium]